MGAFIAETVNDKLGSSGIQKTLIPDYGVGCRKVTPDVGYLEGLVAHNTKVVSGNIRQIARHGVKIMRAKSMFWASSSVPQASISPMNLAFLW